MTYVFMTIVLLSVIDDVCVHDHCPALSVIDDVCVPDHCAALCH